MGKRRNQDCSRRHFDRRSDLILVRWCSKSGQETSLSTTRVANDAVEVYLVDQLTDRPGGAFTYKCGTDDAYVLIDIGKAERNKYLLAHEVGHVLGLMHPDGSGGPAYRNGSTCSVMVVDKPNSSRNTSNNLGIVQLTSNPSLPPNTLAHVLQSVGAGGWETDDGYEHFIRDFPYDDAVQPSALEPPAHNWWTKSDVWNSYKPPSSLNTPNNPPLYNDNTSFIFDSDDNFPNATEPTNAGPNFMYVRLRARDFSQPVSVHLFLAVPGSASETLTRLPVIGAGDTNPLIFSSSDFPPDGTPVMKYVQWTIPSDPNKWPMGYPAHCCVFAVAHSNNESPEPPPPQGSPPRIIDIITTPNSYKFYHLFQRLKSDNDVAQRNLHIQGTPPPGPTPLLSTLAWVQIDNPFERAASAQLEIDATQTLGLASLAIQVDDRPFTEIRVGE